MLGHFIVVLGQVGTLFLLMAVGYVLGRKQWLTEDGCAQLSTVLLYVVAPCIMIEALQIERTPEVIHTLLTSTVTLTGFFLITGLVSLPLFRRYPPHRRAVLQIGSVYGNMGFMGLPLIEAVLGQEAILICVIGIVLLNIAQWSHGATVMGGTFSVRRMFLNPATIPTAIGLALFAFSIRLPGPVMTSVTYLADLNTPLAMLVIGAQMARANLPQTFQNPLLYATAAIKLLLIPGIIALVLLPFHLDPLLYSTCVILAATPTAGITGIFAQRFGRDTATAAQMITLSTLLSAFNLPVFAVLAQHLAG